MKKKILMWDLETAGVNAFYGDLGFVVCFGYKWLGEKKAHCLRLCDYDLFDKNPHDDSALLKDAWKIMAQADVLVAHYGDKFDRKFVRTRFKKAGIPSDPPIIQIDTCKLSRKTFKLSSNRLDNLARFLNVTRKIQKGDGWPGWWLGAMRGHKKSIKDMAVYCKGDVITLEECFVAMKAYVPGGVGLPSTAKNPTHPECPDCSSKNVEKRGVLHTKAGDKQKFLCNTCKRWFSSVSLTNKSFYR